MIIEVAHILPLYLRLNDKSNIIGILDGEESDIGFFGMSKNFTLKVSQSDIAHILSYSYHNKIAYFDIFIIPAVAMNSTATINK